ncbi:adenylate/guanylate cyclase domain-containing protein [Azohydromonas australica]|uniref:adenylate/guanylate cyclase domain-containing protein n=1 Tax=Azohydromonas australica TaxID=364039 RepID=UPI000687D060|nr:adenylate/guanylate cyclase domain-containing protein [Azohydromonas australica]
MTNTARATVGWDAVSNEDVTPLKASQIETSQEEAELGISADDVVSDWKDDLNKNPIGSFVFSRHTPPFADLDLEVLTPKNSRRQEAASVYADIDGFTAYVAGRVNDDEKAKDVVRTLHVLRAEMDCVLYQNFAGRKIRFIGDCVHGVMVEGTAPTTDGNETAKNAMLCAAALRSSFDLALRLLTEEEIDVGNLGLQIGLEYGPIAITRLGVKGEMIRCCISRSVRESERQQLRCESGETSVGAELYAQAPMAFKTLFNPNRRRSGFDYDEAVNALEAENVVAKRAAVAGGGLLRQATAAPAAAAVSGFTFPARAATPSKTPAGFA